MTRNINDWLLSGEAIGLRMRNTLDFEALAPEDAGIFLRANDEGLVYGHRVPSQDIEWVAQNVNSLTITSTPQQILSITIDDDLTPEKGSWVLTGRIDNSSKRDKDLTITIKVDGSVVRQNTVTIEKDTTGFPLTSWGGISNTVPAGSEVILELSCTSDVELRGDLTPTAIKLVEAQVAPITKFIQVNTNLGSGISRGEIESAVGVGVDTLQDTQKFLIADDSGHTWFVVWLKSINKFAVTKLNLK